MRPIEIMISAFGPYAEKTVIPMDKLGKSGIYLITGDTGAGKTTIFDAITFALYGEASGDNRESTMLRSKYAAPEMPTEVKLTFEYKGKNYVLRRNPEYERPSKRGSGVTVQKAEAELYYPDGRVVTKSKDVTKAVCDLIGIDRRQFSQIAMIAQGDFFKLLFSGTEERKKIFRRLFKTELFEKLQQRLKESTSELNSKCENLNASINQYISGTVCCGESKIFGELEDIKSGGFRPESVPDLLKKLIDEDCQREKICEKKLFKIEKELEKVNSNLGKVSEYVKMQKILAEKKEFFENKKCELQALKNIYSMEKEKQPHRESIDSQLIILKNELPKYNSAEAKAEEIKKLESIIKENDNKILQSEKELKELEASLLENLHEAAILEGLGFSLEKLSAEKKDLLQKKEKFESIRGDITKYHVLNKNAAEAKENYEKARSEAAEALHEYALKNTLFLDGQAGVLAETLKENMPCPVCGSLLHPVPAQRKASVPTDTEIEKLKELSDKLQQKTEKLSSICGEFNGNLNALTESLSKDIWEAVGQYLIEEAESKIVEIIESGNRKLIETEEKIKREQAKFEKKMKLKAQIPIEEQTVSEKKVFLEKLKRVKNSYESEIKILKKHYDEMTKELRFEKEELAEKFIAELEEERELAEKSFKDAEKNYNNCKNETEGIKGEIRQITLQLENSEIIDSESENKKKEELTLQKEKCQKQQKEIASRLSVNKRAFLGVQKQSKELKNTENNLTWVKALSDTANGNVYGKEKIMLETYVQMTYFERIIEKANTRFMVMTSGQYEFVRQREADSRKFQSGLELEVIDHYNGTKRSVKTLSGGEAFKASLSLALGLSDEIQSSAGGIQLDTMFVDEGFGSLDDESLSQAMRALSSVSEGNRLVGIISHVGELKNKIERQIIVKKDKIFGSNIELII